MNDSLGDRMKDYERRGRNFLPRRTNTLIRVDGKAFHSYTKNCKRPFDDGLMEDMDSTAIALCEEIQGSKMAYVQSDEISIWLTDYDDITTQAWFDGNINKICSISASVAATTFNKLRYLRLANGFELMQDKVEMVDISEFPVGNFDARAWAVPDLNEVANYFLWRSQDAARNSVSMVANSLYSASDLHEKSNSDRQEMIFQKGINWNDYASRYKCGRLIIKKEVFYNTRDNEDLLIRTARNKWSVHDMEAYNFEFWQNVIIGLAPLESYRYEA